MNNRRIGPQRGSAVLRRCLVLVAALAAFAANAETLWVTDMLQLELYGSADMSGPPIRKLRSGDRLDVIESGSRFAKVRTDDGEQGWVKSLYLVDKEPARTRVNKLEDENAALTKSIAELEARLKAERGRLKELQQTNLGSEEKKAATIEELERLRAENPDMLATLSQYSSSVPLNWLLLAVLVALGGGFAGGWYWVDSRIRARHGGYRIY